MGSGYLADREREILESFPGLAQWELDAANDLFCHYIIYKSERGGRQVWTSCCHRDGAFEPFLRETVTPELRDVLTGRHNDAVVCPWCGRSATLKCRGKFTGRRSTRATGAAVFLGAAPDGALWAQCYWLNKDYLDAPAAYPFYRATSQYYFSPGEALEFWRECYSGKWRVNRESGAVRGGRKNITEPFGSGSYCFPHHDAYAVIGLEELPKTFLRWCDYPAWRELDAPGAELHDDLIRFLTVASVYTRQVEMLVRHKQRTLINDIIWQAKKNARVFKWEETDPRRAFGLNKAELRAYLAEPDGIGLLLTRRLLGCSYAEAAGWHEDALTGFEHFHDLESFVKLCRERGAEVNEARKYLCRFTGVRCHGGVYGLVLAVLEWRDYLANAQTAGMDLTQRSILYPRDLFEAHDNAMNINRAQKEAEDKKKLQALRRATAARARALNQRYGFETEHYIIRAPKNAGEIVAEGRELHHCVGGYAQRHAEGTVTILFLRDKKKPNTPLCTIEVNGDRLVQIHGYGNERASGSVKPQTRFAEIYEPWSQWLRKGCPRRSDGSPAVPKSKKRKGNVA